MNKHKALKAKPVAAPQPSQRDQEYSNLCAEIGDLYAKGELVKREIAFRLAKIDALRSQAAETK